MLSGIELGLTAPDGEALAATGSGHENYLSSVNGSYPPR
jgi:hypothetical protein